MYREYTIETQIGNLIVTILVNPKGYDNEWDFEKIENEYGDPIDLDGLWYKGYPYIDTIMELVQLEYQEDKHRDFYDG